MTSEHGVTINGQAVLVTGCERGIGLAFAEQYAAAGSRRPEEKS